MITSLKELRQAIRECINEYGAPTGKLRKPGSRASGKTQYKIGFTPDENRELDAFTANKLFPGAVEAWTEVANEFSAEFSMDPFVVRKRSTFFQIGDKLRVALERNVQNEIAEWHPEMGEDGDWIDI